MGGADARSLVTGRAAGGSVVGVRHLALILVMAFAVSAPPALPVAVAQTMQPGDKTDAGIRDGSEQRRLTGARRSWKAAGVSSYSFHITRACYCPRAEDIRIAVRRGRPAATTGVELLDVATVPRMFRRIQRSIDGRVAGLTVRYGKRGIPSSISIDGSLMVADDELGYTITRFTPLK